MLDCASAVVAAVAIAARSSSVHPHRPAASCHGLMPAVELPACRRLFTVRSSSSAQAIDGPGAVKSGGRMNAGDAAGAVAAASAVKQTAEVRGY